MQLEQKYLVAHFWSFVRGRRNDRRTHEVAFCREMKIQANYRIIAVHIVLCLPSSCSEKDIAFAASTWSTPHAQIRVWQ